MEGNLQFIGGRIHVGRKENRKRNRLVTPRKRKGGKKEKGDVYYYERREETVEERIRKGEINSIFLTIDGQE